MNGFAKKSSQFSFICKICEKETLKKTGKSDIYCENLYSHLLSDTHKKNTKQEEEQDYEQLKKLINDHLSNKKKKKKDEKGLSEKINEENEEVKVYLNFVAFLLKERLSYVQVERIGKYLQNLI